MVQNSDFYDLIDRIVCLDIGARGVAGLFEPWELRAFSINVLEL